MHLSRLTLDYVAKVTLYSCRLAADAICVLNTIGYPVQFKSLLYNTSNATNFSGIHSSVTYQKNRKYQSYQRKSTLSIEQPRAGKFPFNCIDATTNDFFDMFPYILVYHNNIRVV